MPLELMDISISKNEARAYNGIRSRCYKTSTDDHGIFSGQLTQLGPPFFLTAKRNDLVGVGSSTETMLVASLIKTDGFYTSCRTSVGRKSHYARMGYWCTSSSDSTAGPKNSLPLDVVGGIKNEYQWR